MGLQQSSQVSDKEIREAARLLAGGGVVAFTGAGVSAESGVPTYRDPGGLWRKFDMKKVSHIDSFLRDPVSCWRFELELYRLLRGVEPNAGHFALAELEAAGLLTGVVTQNVEGLHSRAGSRNVIELHGNETQAVCLRCGARCSAVEAFRSIGWLGGAGGQEEIVEEALPDIASILHTGDGGSSSSSAGSSPSTSPTPRRGRSLSGASASGGSSGARRPSPDSSASLEAWRGSGAPPVPPGAPSCPTCGVGLLKPDAVYFGENLDVGTLQRAERLFKDGRVALVVGSTCRVAPASTLPLLLRSKGGQLIDVNPDKSCLSQLADKWLRGSSADVLPRLAHVALEAQAAGGKQRQPTTAERLESEDSLQVAGANASTCK